MQKCTIKPSAATTSRLGYSCTAVLEQFSLEIKSIREESMNYNNNTIGVYISIQYQWDIQLHNVYICR